MTARTARKPAAKKKAAEVGGRVKLINAALSLAARNRSLHALGVRELGREAGLNPNTFYRHFGSLDELGLAIIDTFSQDLLPALRAIRLAKQPADTISTRTVLYIFDYARAHPEAFIVGVRELYGVSTAVRLALRERMRLIASEMCEDLVASGVISAHEIAMLEALAIAMVEQVFHRTLDYLEKPRTRKNLVRSTANFIDTVMAGALALKAKGRWSL